MSLTWPTKITVLRDWATHKCGHTVEIKGLTYAELRYLQRTAYRFFCIGCEVEMVIERRKLELGAASPAEKAE